jgi:hypothetical protein
MFGASTAAAGSQLTRPPWRPPADLINIGNVHAAPIGRDVSPQLAALATGRIHPAHGH